MSTWQLHGAWHIVAFLPLPSAAALLQASSELSQDLRAACAVLCGATVAQRRARAAVQSLRRELRNRQCPEPKKYKRLQTVAEQIEQRLSGSFPADAETRACLARGMLPLQDPGCMPDEFAAAALHGLILDCSAFVRAIVAVCLGCMGSTASPYMGALARQLSDPSEDVRRASVEALGMLGPIAAPHTMAVASALRDPDPHVSAKAGVALKRIAAPIDVARSMEHLLSDQNCYVRARAVYALGQLGWDAAVHADAVVALLEDEHHNVRVMARQALRQIVGAECMPAICISHSTVSDTRPPPISDENHLRASGAPLWRQSKRPRS